MLRYSSKRHRRLMYESEHALFKAAAGRLVRTARIAGHVVRDSKIHRIWEGTHANLVRPVAEQNRRAPQIIELRLAEVRLTHKRALIDYIRKHKIAGAQRDRLFAAFYGSKETVDAILSEHRNYMVAVSSRIATDHLIDVMCDPVSKDLINLYEQAYEQYFELFCFAAGAEDSTLADAVRRTMRDVAERARRIRSRLVDVRADNRHADFDRQARLARSGRYKVLNYYNA